MTANTDRWILLSGGEYSGNGILQLGQVLTSPFEPDSSLFRNSLPLKPEKYGPIDKSVKQEVDRKDQVEIETETTTFIMFPSSSLIKKTLEEREVGEQLEHIQGELYMITGIRIVDEKVRHNGGVVAVTGVSEDLFARSRKNSISAYRLDVLHFRDPNRIYSEPYKPQPPKKMRNKLFSNLFRQRRKQSGVNVVALPDVTWSGSVPTPRESSVESRRPASLQSEPEWLSDVVPTLRSSTSSGPGTATDSVVDAKRSLELAHLRRGLPMESSPNLQTLDPPGYPSGEAQDSGQQALNQSSQSIAGPTSAIVPPYTEELRRMRQIRASQKYDGYQYENSSHPLANRSERQDSNMNQNGLSQTLEENQDRQSSESQRFPILVNRPVSTLQGEERNPITINHSPGVVISRQMDIRVENKSPTESRHSLNIAGEENESEGNPEDGAETNSKVGQRNEVAFDSATIMSVSDMSTARAQATKWFEDRDRMKSVNRFFLQFRKSFEHIDDIPHATIAILDTGIDLDHPALKIYRDRKQINGLRCRDFVVPGKSPITDSTGHGTHCAHLVLKVCKTAKLVVARVLNRDQGDEGAGERIVPAINWAMKNRADIIVMAFAFSTFQENVHEAIVKAEAERKVLIFAAASNNKHNEENSVGYPARSSEVIRVNSCTWQGRQSNFSPNCFEVRHNLCTIGEELQAAFSEYDNDKNESRNQSQKCMSGTSMSTAILAGIAGLVLEFSRMTTEKGPNVEHQERLLLNEGMMAILQHCMAGVEPLRPDRYCYIRPWLLFRPAAPRAVIVHTISELLQKCI